ncbi:MAG: NAD-dependent epimerase/dehydratase family protein [Verrucomicrobiae bacterium]|nr:NAD-dependent epimerase/dehydratase family protein [Verrucomicrobiae bacterium]
MFKNSHCLVTGGTGFIGRYVVRRLLLRGAKVRVFCRSPEKAQRLFGGQVDVALGDLLHEKQLREACRGIETIVHVGGAYWFGRRYRDLMMEANVKGTENVLRAAWKESVGRIAHVSSSGILVNNHSPITERDFPAHVPRRQYYRRSKWLSELEAMKWAAKGLQVSIASPVSPVGAEDETPTPTGRIVLDYLRGAFPFVARTAMNFIDVTELADGILAVAENGRRGERYTIGNHNMWLADFFQILENCSEIPAPKRVLPWPFITAAGSIGELFGGTRVCWETACHSKGRQFFDLSKSEAELKWRPSRPIKASARESIAWFQSMLAQGAVSRSGELDGAMVARLKVEGIENAEMASGK